MALFEKILAKLGLVNLGKEEEKTSSARMPGVTSSSASVAVPTSVSVVDVEAQLESNASQSNERLNWRTSIVDLLKLLSIDSSLASRKELALELGCPQNLMKNSADMNIWLHKTVLKKIADNGGNIPRELLD